MTWIPIIPPQEAKGELQQAYADVNALYPPEYQRDVDAVRRGDGPSDSIVAAHSLIPQALRHSMSAYGVLLSPELPLTRRQHEMIATVVSALNGCFYWRESHAEFLRRVSLDAELAAQLGRDYTQAALDEADLAMLDYAAKLTRHAVRVMPEDLDRLRAVGFSDQAILQINLIASWFNYINRVADGLGVGR
jgi:uncharacterized peroxidase-related enzyme